MRVSKSHIVFLAAGALLFALLVARFGVGQLGENIGRAGLSLLYVFLVWLAIYILNTLAWKFVLGVRGIPFARLFTVTVAGFVLNYITPLVALGGEPYKVRALSGAIGVPESLSAVVLYRMVHLLGHMFLLLAGILAAIAVLPLPAPVLALLIAAGVVIAAVIEITLAGHRAGVFSRMAAFLRRRSLFRRITSRLEGKEDQLRKMDDLLTHAYRNDRARFYAAVGLEVLSRLCMGLEVYIILQGAGVGISFASAVFMYVVYSVIINLLFFIPLNLGAREGGLVLGLQSLALAPVAGVYLGVVMRIREFCWILIGLLFIALAGARKDKAPAAP